MAFFVLESLQKSVLPNPHIVIFAFLKIKKNLNKNIMRGSLLTNVLLIVLLALWLGSTIYNMVLVNDVADEANIGAGVGLRFN